MLVKVGRQIGISVAAALGCSVTDCTPQSVPSNNRPRQMLRSAGANLGVAL